MPFEYEDPIIHMVRKGTDDDPYIMIKEALIVDKSGKVVLTEKPNKFRGVKVKDDKGNYLNETTDALPDTNEFHVDYMHKVVTFNKVHAGKQFEFHYFGEGNTFIPANSIYTERDGLTIKETLQQLTDTTAQVRDETRQTNIGIQENENVRINNENKRKENENTRQQNEQQRQRNELTRQSQEASRQENTAKAISDAEKATANANNQANYAKQQGDYAKTQGNYAKEQGDYAKREADRLMNTDVSELDLRIGKLDDLKTTDRTSIVNAINENVSKYERETATLQHGLNIINTDQASPMKVEFYGNTLVNLLGKSLNDPNGWILEDNTNIKDGVLTMMADGSDFVDVIKPTNLKDNAYYLVRLNVIDSKFTTNIPFVLVRRDEYGLSDHINLLPDEKGFVYKTFKTGIISDNRFHMFIRLVEPQGNFIKIKDLAIYEIDEETYNKIGVSLTDEDVERMFPYVDGIQHVRNPYVKVEGENLVPTDVDGWEVGGLKWADGELYNDSRSLRTINYISVKPNTQLTANVYGDYLCTVFEYDNDKKFVRTWSGNYFFPKRTEIVSEKTKFIKLVVRRSDETEGITKDEIMKAQPMLVLGSQSKPFTPYNPSYLYAETVLAGNNDKKDILYYNESKNRWEKIKWWETDVVLDGRWNWEHRINMNVGNNVKVVRFEYPFTNILSNTPDSKEHRGNVTNYKGEILKVRYMADGLDEEAFNVHPDKHIYFAIPNENSGWTYEITPTSNMIKAYFNGWKYTGDGTNHSWCAIGDESITETDINVTSTTLSPTMQDGTIQPYKLTYQLAEPEIEVVQVEGDLAINGTTQVEVGSGVIVREKANPVKSTLYPIYLINDINLKPSKLKNRVKQIVSVYKNNKEITNYIIQNINAYGSEKVSIREEDFDPNAIYEVTYIAEQPNFTCNLEEVKATYSNNIRSALDDTIAKLTNNVTDTTVLKRQMLDVIARLEAMEGTE